MQKLKWKFDRRHAAEYLSYRLRSLECMKYTTAEQIYDGKPSAISANKPYTI